MVVSRDNLKRCQRISSETIDEPSVHPSLKFLIAPSIHPTYVSLVVAIDVPDTSAVITAMNGFPSTRTP